MRSHRVLTYMPDPYGIRSYTMPRKGAYLSEHAESLLDSGKPSVLQDLILQALPIVSKGAGAWVGNPAGRSLLGGLVLLRRNRSSLRQDLAARTKLHEDLSAAYVPRAGPPIPPMLKHAGPGIQIRPLTPPCGDGGVSFGAAFRVPLKCERIDGRSAHRPFMTSYYLQIRPVGRAWSFFGGLAFFLQPISPRSSG